MLTSQTIDPVETLSDSRVRNYFLGIMDSPLPTQDKYQRFIDFFKELYRLRHEFKAKGFSAGGEGEQTLKELQELLNNTSSSWVPEEITRQLRQSIVRAVRRLTYSRHEDGSWGFEYETSSFWATGFAVLCLNEAAKLDHIDFGADTVQSRENGIKWLEREENRVAWNVTSIPVDEKIPVYEIFLAACCFYQVGPDRFSSEFARTLKRCLKRLVNIQGPDGGWAPRNRSGKPQPLAGSENEVGATALAIRALGMANNPAFKNAVILAMNSLLNSQNSDGSWNYIFSELDVPQPSITKTCDALAALMFNRELLLGQDPDEKETTRFETAIEKGIDWLKENEKPIIDQAGKAVTGWGWMTDDAGEFDHDNTCLTLETLVQMPDPELPLLNSSALWLVKNQKHADGDPEDGKWEKGHTARITMALIRYYMKFREWLK